MLSYSQKIIFFSPLPHKLCCRYISRMSRSRRSKTPASDGTRISSSRVLLVLFFITSSSFYLISPLGGSVSITSSLAVKGLFASGGVEIVGLVFVLVVVVLLSSERESLPPFPAFILRQQFDFRPAVFSGIMAPFPARSRPVSFFRSVFPFFYPSVQLPLRTSSYFLRFI